jgi:hypothetical protein
MATQLGVAYCELDSVRVSAWELGLVPFSTALKVKDEGATLLGRTVWALSAPPAKDNINRAIAREVRVFI